MARERSPSAWPSAPRSPSVPGPPAEVDDEAADDGLAPATADEIDDEDERDGEDDEVVGPGDPVGEVPAGEALRCGDRGIAAKARAAPSAGSSARRVRPSVGTKTPAAVTATRMATAMVNVSLRAHGRTAAVAYAITTVALDVHPRSLPVG